MRNCKTIILVHPFGSASLFLLLLSLSLSLSLSLFSLGCSAGVHGSLGCDVGAAAAELIWNQASVDVIVVLVVLVRAQPVVWTIGWFSN